MLVPVPYQAPEKKAKKKGKEAKGGLHRKGTSDAVSGDIEAPSSHEGDEDEEEEEGEEEAPEIGADDQPQLDHTSNNEPRPSEPAAAEGDQAETGQPAAPPTCTTDSTVLPDSSVAS